MNILQMNVLKTFSLGNLTQTSTAGGSQCDREELQEESCADREHKRNKTNGSGVSENKGEMPSSG